MNEFLADFDGYQRLAAAIIKCAAEDYREAYGTIYFFQHAMDYTSGKMLMNAQINNLKIRDMELAEEYTKLFSEVKRCQYNHIKCAPGIRRREADITNLRRQIRASINKYLKAMRACDDFTEFINSDWYATISNGMDGEYIKNAMERQAMNGNIKGFNGI